MTKRIDSQALGVVTKSLGLTGAGAQVTELIDGTVDQVLDVGELARRGRTQGDIQGIFTPIFRNTHTDANTVSVAVDPYNVGTTIVVAPYPPEIGPGFDVWLIGASLRHSSGTASGFALGTLSLTVGTQSEGWGSHAGSQILVAQPMRLAQWDSMATDVSAFGVLAGDRGPHERIGLRLPRGGGGSILTFASVSTVTVGVDCQLILGVFPVALGQDIAI